MFPSEIQAFRRHWAEKLAEDALARRVVAALWRIRGVYVSPILQRTRGENPVIDAVIANEVPEVTRHINDHFRALLALPTARALGSNPMAFVVEHGIRRARGGVPLRAVLQAYRTGHKSYWTSICTVINQLATSPEAGMKTTMLLSDYCIDYTDLISAIVTDAYVAEEAKLNEERTRLSIAVIQGLLRGELPETEQGRRLCEQSALRSGRQMVVVVARGGALGGHGQALRERGDLATMLGQILCAPAFGCLVEPRIEDVIAVVSCENAAAENAAKALRAHYRSPSGHRKSDIRIGIGLDVAEVSELPRSFKQALLSLDIPSGAGPISYLGEAGIDAYLWRTADATARRLAPPLPAEVRSGPLAQVLEAFAASDLNVKACAHRLGVHGNTVYHRLGRVQRLTGIDPRSFRGLSQLIMALRLHDGARSHSTQS